MARKKILVVTGSRAEYGLLKPIMEAVEVHPTLSLSVLATGMHTLKTFGLTIREVTRSYKPHIVPVREKNTMLESFAQEIVGIEKYCQRNRPDCIIVLGDRDEPLAAALVASHLNIPLAHIHGGDVSGPTVDVSNRTLITKLAHMHFPATKMSARRIKALGEDSWRVIVAGAPGLDALTSQLYSRAELSKKLKLSVSKPWILFVQHPTPFEDASIAVQAKVYKSLTKFPEFEKIIIYPNSDTGSGVFVSTLQNLRGPNYHAFRSLPRDVYVSLLKESNALVGNSSSGIIEANFLGTPVVNIGNRQQGRERGDGVIDSSYNSDHIVVAIHKAFRLKKKYRGRPIPAPYGRGTAGTTIAAAIAQLLKNPQQILKKTGVDTVRAYR